MRQWMGGLMGWLVAAAVLAAGPAGAEADAGAPNVDQLFEQAGGYYDEYTWDRAAALFGQFIDRAPDDPRVPEAGYKRLRALLEIDQLPNPEEALKRFARQHEGSLWAARALLLLAQEGGQQPWGQWEDVAARYESAIRAFRGAIGRRPMDPAERVEYHDFLFAAVEYYLRWHDPRATEVANQHLESILAGQPTDEAAARALYMKAQLAQRRFQRESDEAAETEARRRIRERVSELLLRVVHQYPNTEVADDALWMLAQQDLSQEDYVLARARFKELVKRYPRSQFIEPARRQIAQIEAPVVQVQVSHTHLPSAGVPTTLRARNVSAVEFTVYRLNPEALIKRSVLGGSPDALISAGTKVTTWRQPVPDDGKYQVHTEKLDARVREPGVYLLHAQAVGQPKAIAYSLINITSLVLVEQMARQDLVSYVASRTTQRPVEGAEVTVYRPLQKSSNTVDLQRVDNGATNADGLWRTKLPWTRDGERRLFAIVRHGDEVVVPSNALYGWWQPPQETLVGYLFTDRPVYRPEDTVQFQAILRTALDGDYSNLPNKPVTITIHDARGEEVLSTEGKTDDYGMVGGELKLTEEPALGVYNIQITAGDWATSGQFRVEEYRKPEFEVSVGKPLGEVRPGGAAAVPISAQYYFGAPVAGAEVRYVVQRRPYVRWSPWWRGPWDWFYAGWDGPYHGYQPETVVTEGTVTTDEQGEAIVEFPVVDDDEDYVYTVQATVTDVTRRVIEASGSITVTQHGFFLEARSAQGLYKPGNDAVVEITAKDADNQPVATRVTAELWRMKWVADRTNANGDVVPAHFERDTRLWGGRTVNTDPDTGQATLRFTAPPDGHYAVLLTAPDSRNPNEEVTAKAMFWTADDAWQGRNYNYTDLALISDRDLYRKGETMRFLVNSPVESGTLLITLGAEDIFDTQVVRYQGHSTVIELPVKDTYAPNVHVHAVVVGLRQVYFAQENILVPPTDELLNVKVETDADSYKPRTTGRFTVTTTNDQGQPVKARVVLGVADESVYAIQDELMPPLGVFFYGSQRPDMIRTLVSFEGWGEYDEEALKEADRRLARGAAGPQGPPGAPMAAMEAAPTADMADGAALGRGGMGGGGEEPVTVREFFPDTLLFRAVETGDDGTATVEVEFPDSLTTWRATARAVTTDTQVGQATDDVVTTKDLLVRLQAPRFFVQTDEVLISAIVTNRTSEPQTVSLQLEVDGLELVGEATAAVDVPANGQTRIDRLVKAVTPGTATITVTGRGANDSDALRMTYPVLPHGAEKFDAAAGKVGADGAARFALSLPAERRDDATQLQVTVSPTLGATLLDALPYLISYPYGCVEQIVSRFVPAVLVARILGYTGELGAGARPANLPAWWDGRGLGELDAVVQAGLARIGSMQNGDGGYGWFSGMSSDPYMTAYVVYALSQARLADVAVPNNLIEPAARYLFQQVDRDYGIDLVAYIAWVLAEAVDNGVLQPAAGEREALLRGVERVYKARNELNEYTRALLVLTLAAVDRTQEAQVAWRNLQAYRTETDNGVHWGENRWGWRFSQNQVEATAMALQAALAVEPDSPLADKAVNWLVLNRTGSHWTSTKETANVIYALVKFMDQRGELDARYEATVLVNGREVAGFEVTPDNALTLDGRVDVDPALLQTGENTIEVRREGEGALYYSAMLEYYTTESFITGASNYIDAERTYYKVIEETDPETQQRVTRREKLANGEPIASGEQIEVEVKVTAEMPFDYLCFIDPKPAGCEPVDQTSGGLWSGSYVYRELRDETVDFFVDHLQQGETTFTYRLRAETPGLFHALPHHGFNMYRPDVRTLSDEGIVRVTEREENKG